ncbi:hypothetical protein ACPPVT_00970 [Angustibacter sp. McL0619]|uniref:hypothetical protein n=1 Tax=Angustibacter sp. McL0619 TaxID=3415676 RepID=UPI003CF794F8
MRRLGFLLSMAILGALFIAFPTSAMASGSIGALSINPDSVRDGQSTTGTVDLGFADPAPTVVRLFSGDPSAAQVPVSITIPAGQTTGSFTITSNAAAAPEIVQILGATPDNISRAHLLSVNPATPAGPSLSSVSFVPTSVVGGQNATGTVRFTAAMTQGAVVQLSSSQPAIARVPQETVVGANTSTSTFNLATSAVSTATSVTITASWFGVTRTTTITLTPGAPPAADVVRITKATWKRGLLTIEATSTNPNAILSVFSASGSFLFDLTNKGGGRFADQRGFVTNPVQISVRSNFGGSASAVLKS